MNEPLLPPEKHAEALKTKASLRRSVIAVAWSFLGVRKHSEYQEDIARITPLHVLGVGFVGGLLFVLALIGFVHWVVA
jgi:hypothetical protein